MRNNKTASKLALVFGAAAVIGSSVVVAQSELVQPGKAEASVARAEAANSTPSLRLKKFNRDEREKPQKKEDPKSEALKNLTLLYDLYQSLSKSPAFSRLRM